MVTAQENVHDDVCSEGEGHLGFFFLTNFLVQ